MVPDGDVIPSPVIITAGAARRLTDQIKVAVEATWQLVVEAYETRAWVALGYSSWDDYTTREFGSCRLRLPREERQDVVASLRDAGLSIRAIAAATGVGIGTVHRELAPVPNGTPQPGGAGPLVDRLDQMDKLIDDLDEASKLADIPDDVFDRIIDECKAEGDLSRAAVLHRADEKAGEGKILLTVPGGFPIGTKVTGTDGKQYPKPSRTPTGKWRRPPLTDAAQKTGFEARRIAARLEKIKDDDRFGRQTDRLAEVLRPNLVYLVRVCQDMLDQFDAGGRP